MSVIDYYDILGCTKESTYEEIRHAYHALALQFHPDKCPSELDGIKFQRILEAWKVLGDPRLKEEYDIACKQAELDSESILVYARISSDELKVADDDEDVLIYQCRCGGAYRVQREHLREKNSSVHVSCQECTFLIVVET